MLGVDPLPDLFVAGDVPHAAVFGKLELTGHPFRVGRHAETKIKTVFNRN